jgi:DNA invertase Pin-like site-specific DNA recombinase
MSSRDTDTAAAAAARGEPPAVTADGHAVSPLRSGKIHARHLERLAIVYVRQSSAQQVVEHQESRARQYALADHAAALGWPKDRVLVVDEDQGHSGRAADHRAGFQRLLGEVTTDRAGLVLGLEMSRLARSSKDWHLLLEWCALFGTLLADQDGVYDPNDTNDRLLLGLKGTMSEFELFTMRNRLQRGVLHKARRGELFIAVPRGYLKLPSGEVVLEPDEQARAVVRLIFEKFEELGTVNGVFRYLLRHQVRVGLRVKHGPRCGQLEWHRPTLHGIADMLRHPMYAGAYAFGRKPVDPRRTTATGRKAQRHVPMNEWKVLLRDRLPAYISWDRYLANLERLRENRFLPDSRGGARAGAALLAGLVICGNCGRRLQTRYHASGAPHYVCTRHYQLGTPQECYGLKAAGLDELVAGQVLCALEPAALELSLQAVTDVQCERERLDQLWRQRLERARYETRRAERQYQAVEPEHRLVARSLERRWEEALQEQRRLEEEYQSFVREQPLTLAEEERARVAALSADIPALWRAPGTAAADRKEVIRCLVTRVVVQVRKDSERVGVAIHWEGGFASQHELSRPVRLYEQLRDFDGLMGRVVALREGGATPAAIAERLNEEGFSPPTRRGAFNAALVRGLLARRGLTNERECTAPLGPHEWWLADLAGELGVARGKLREWIGRGWVRCRRTPAQGLLIAWADRDELRRLGKLKERSRRGVTGHPAELTAPKGEPRGAGAGLEGG